MAQNEEKIVSASSRNLAVATAEDLYGLYIEGVFFGTMNDEFNPEFQVTWGSSIGDIVGSMNSGKAEGATPPKPKINGIVQTLTAVGNRAQLATLLTGTKTGNAFGLMAKKVFDKSEYWSWSANVTLVDWNGEGLVWERWRQLKEIALPHTLAGGGAGGAIASSAMSGFLSAGFKGAAKNAVLAGGALVASDFTGLMDEEALEGALARSTVNAPEPVHIRVGRYGATQGSSPVASMRMVITSFSATFSKEMTEAGPVEGVFNISFESVEPMTAESMPVGGSRVSFVEEG